MLARARRTVLRWTRSLAAMADLDSFSISKSRRIVAHSSVSMATLCLGSPPSAIPVSSCGQGQCRRRAQAVLNGDHPSEEPGFICGHFWLT